MKTYILLTALTVSISLQAQNNNRQEIVLEKSSVTAAEVLPSTWNITSLEELKQKPTPRSKAMELTKEMWTQASGGTPDIFQVDSFMGGVGMVPKLDKLAPGSKGCFGLINQHVDSTNRKEYIGINLAKPLEEGKTYTLCCWIYKQEGTPKTSIALYGNDQEKALPFGDDSTMQSPTFYNEDFQILGWVEYKDVSEWKQVYITFTATKNFRSLVLGPDEEKSPEGGNAKHYNYYFIDGITLNQTKNNSPSSVTINEMPLFEAIPDINSTTPNGEDDNINTDVFTKPK